MMGKITAKGLLLALSLICWAVPALGAEQITVKMGGDRYTVTVAEIENFLQTGETTLEVPESVKQNPALRLLLLQLLRQEVPIPRTTGEGQDLLMNIGKEVLLQQVAAMIRPGGGGDSLAMLRSAFQSSVRHGKINPLRFIRNFPDREIIIDGDRLAELQRLLFPSPEK